MENTERNPSDLFKKLQQINFNTHVSVVRTLNGEERSYVHQYANKFDLQHRNCIYRDFPNPTLLKCIFCKTASYDNEMSWYTDFSTIIPGSILGEYSNCNGCGENIYNPDYGTKNFFKVNTCIPNAILIGTNLDQMIIKKYPKRCKRRAIKSKKEDQACDIEIVKSRIGKIYTPPIMYTHDEFNQKYKTLFIFFLIY